MMTKKPLTIRNGKILHDDGYPNDFHQFLSEKFLQLKILLPGVNSNSIRVKTLGKTIVIKANIEKDCYDIFKAKTIEIKGQLSKKVIEGPIRATYKSGVLKIDLVLDKVEEEQ